MVSESLPDEEVLPSCSVLRSSKDIQKQLDDRIGEIESQSKIEGKDSKLKSKCGGLKFWCLKKWLGRMIMFLWGVGGAEATRQWVAYNQLTFTQFIQGFTRSITDETNNGIREHMLWYLHDLMEDATDFMWGSAKAAHAVLFCKMERGTVSLSDTSCRDLPTRKNILILTSKIGLRET